MLHTGLIRARNKIQGTESNDVEIVDHRCLYAVSYDKISIVVTGMRSAFIPKQGNEKWHDHQPHQTLENAAGRDHCSLWAGILNYSRQQKETALPSESNLMVAHKGESARPSPTYEP